MKKKILTKLWIVSVCSIVFGFVSVLYLLSVCSWNTMFRLFGIYQGGWLVIAFIIAVLGLLSLPFAIYYKKERKTKKRLIASVIVSVVFAIVLFVALPFGMWILGFENDYTVMKSPNGKYEVVKAKERGLLGSEYEKYYVKDGLCTFKYVCDADEYSIEWGDDAVVFVENSKNDADEKIEVKYSDMK